MKFFSQALALNLLLALPAMAHSGHGAASLESTVWHYLTEPAHIWPALTFLLLGVLFSLRGKIISKVLRAIKVPSVKAHCDGPCGVYDPASARISAEAVLSMTKKILALEVPDASDKEAYVKYHNTLARYISVKEEQAHETKEHLLVLWTDFFKPQHLEKYPELHDLIWKATKECSYAKQEVSMHHAEQLMELVEKVHNIFWEAKGREVEWVLANPA